MCEAWEDILLEMDSKLMKFAEQKAVSHTCTYTFDDTHYMVIRN